MINLINGEKYCNIFKFSQNQILYCKIFELNIKMYKFIINEVHYIKNNKLIYTEW